MGDPSGIGPEVVLKATAAISNREGAPSFVVIGDLATMQETAAHLKGVPPPVEWHAGKTIAPDALGVLQITKLAAEARRPGKPCIAGGDASFKYAETGARMTRDREVDALVTAPISKQCWDRAGHNFPGHTELLAKIAKARNWRMMFAGTELRLALVTVHVPLGKVSRMLNSKNVLDTIVILERHLRENEGAPRPRIGVLGFNPHAGEGGLFGDEEIRVIEPAIRRAQARGIDAHGPLAPDTAFIRNDGRFGFDAAVAMYHDQGLIALKTLEFDRAVNVTIGLPFIRTSPDHGTAFEIAGRGVANPSSMIAAIEYASRAVKARDGAGRRAA
ncbi:MAG TPA: 4-hydroxythreonine-4-phosphate dehydrogenase PdxA [Candidatus Binataceae bacterium]|nr:4-hydroxythreonine-4-phosphate dehydrogenase PdxA [Candidatus Binataceae bacterium]